MAVPDGGALEAALPLAVPVGLVAVGLVAVELVALSRARAAHT